jgi:Papain-like cysteine protease AvrRpt2
MTASINFTMEDQVEDEWCWAANAVSAAEFFGSTAWTRCLLVNHQFGQTTCCVNPDSNDCNKPSRLDIALGTVGCHYTWTGSALTIEQVFTSLSAGIVIEARIGWPDGTGYPYVSGHFVAITGVDTVSAQVYIQDPWYKWDWHAFSDFSTAYQTSGVWTDTYLIDRLVVVGATPGGGASSVAGPRPSGLKLVLKATIMADQTETPIFTLALDKAAAPNPFSALKQTGSQVITDTGVGERIIGSNVLAFRTDGRAVTEAQRTRAAMSQLVNPRIVMIPSLLVTVIIGNRGPSEAIRPIGRVPSFLQADRTYSKDEFESIIREQAAHKLELLDEMDPGARATNPRGAMADGSAQDEESDETFEPPPTFNA